jgi:NitT/TauT family transport system permease protein
MKQESAMTINRIGNTYEYAPDEITLKDHLIALWNRVGPPVSFFIAIMLIWETSVTLLEVPSFIVPAPSAVAKTFFSGVVSGAYVDDFLVTAFEAVSGFGMGSLMGLALGTIIVMFPFLERIIYPYVVALQSVPKVAVAPLLVVWFGFGMSSKIIIVALVSLFPVLVNVIAGLRSVDEERLDLLRALGASKWQIFWHLRFPSSLPFFFAGLNTAIVLSVIGAIVGEFVGATKGIGFRILQANYALDIAGAFALFLVLSLMGLTLHSILKFTERRVVFWTNVPEKK